MFELVCMCVDAANVFLHGVASIFKPRLLELHNCHEKLIILIVYSSCVQLIWGVEPTHWRTKQQSSSSLNLSIAMGGGLDLEIANSSVPRYLGYFLVASARSLGGNFLGPRWTFLGISKEIPWNFQGFFSKPRWKPRWNTKPRCNFLGPQWKFLGISLVPRYLGKTSRYEESFPPSRCFGTKVPKRSGLIATEMRTDLAFVSFPINDIISNEVNSSMPR